MIVFHILVHSLCGGMLINVSDVLRVFFDLSISRVRHSPLRMVCRETHMMMISVNVGHSPCEGSNNGPKSDYVP